MGMLQEIIITNYKATICSEDSQSSTLKMTNWSEASSPSGLNCTILLYYYLCIDGDVITTITEILHSLANNASSCNTSLVVGIRQARA